MKDTIAPTLKESFLNAKQRYQPYINLTNQVYKIEALVSEDTLKEYKQQGLKSLYFRTEKLKLDEQLGTQIGLLVDSGVREIFVFCDKEQSKIDSSQFNKFLDQHKIRINLKIVQISEVDLAQINQDSIGSEDLLGFSGLLDYKITYRNGFSINLLNNADSDKTILNNYNKYKQEIAEKHSFVDKEPSYITSSPPDAERRIKDPSKKQTKASVARQHQIDKNENKNTERSLSIDVNKNKEMDISVDETQKAHKLDRNQALKQAKKIIKSSFYEFYITTDIKKLKSVISNLDSMASKAVNKLFESSEKIQFITKTALELIIQNYFLFQSGINIENLPLGFAFTNGVIFSSDQRKKSMPENEFTIGLNEIKPGISNPLQYSWLFFATQANISLDDLYSTEKAPTLKGKDRHPGIDSNLDDKGLDLPINLLNSEYEIHTNVGGEESVSYKDISKSSFENNNADSPIVLINPNIDFLKLVLSHERFKLREHNLPQEAIAAINKYSPSNDAKADTEEEELIYDKALPLIESQSFEEFKKLVTNYKNFDPNADTILQSSIAIAKDNDNFLKFILCHKLFDINKHPISPDEKTIVDNCLNQINVEIKSVAKRIENGESISKIAQEFKDNYKIINGISYVLVYHKVYLEEWIKAIISFDSYDPNYKAEEMLTINVQLLKHKSEVFLQVATHKDFNPNDNFVLHGAKKLKETDDRFFKAILANVHFDIDLTYLSNVESDKSASFLNVKSQSFEDFKETVVGYTNFDPSKDIIQDSIEIAIEKNDPRFLKFILCHKHFNISTIYDLSEKKKELGITYLNQIKTIIKSAAERIKNGESISEIVQEFKDYYKIINGISDALKFSQIHLEKWTKAIINLASYNPNYYEEWPAIFTSKHFYTISFGDPSTSPTKMLITYGSEVFKQVVSRRDFYPNIEVLEKVLGLHDFSVPFYSISSSDVLQLENIYMNLMSRDMFDIFCKTIANHYITDGGFLLEEKTAIFLKKLFEEILPVSETEKIKFFKHILEDGYIFENSSRIKSQSSIEDVFEALNGCYKKLQEFLLKNEFSEAERTILENEITIIIKNQIEDGLNLRIIIERTWDALKYIINKGGSLHEQIKYLIENGNLMKEPAIFEQAKKFGFNIIDESTELDTQYSDYYHKPTVSLSTLEEQLFEVNCPEENRKELLGSALRYLSTVPPHQRTSIETYKKFVIKVTTNERDCSGSLSDDPLRTVEYRTFASPDGTESNLLKYTEIRNKLLSEAKGDFNTLVDLVNNVPKVPVKEFCYPQVAVVGENANLVTNFTAKQASENVRLFVLNVPSSAKEHYDSHYPNQNWEQIVSLLNVLFSKVKIYDDVEIGTRELDPKQNHNYNSISISTKIQGIPLPQSVLDKEEQHKKIVETFIDIYKNNPELNFFQIIALGSVINTDVSLGTKAIESAKSLYLEHKHHFTQLVRILLSTAVSEGNGLDELNERSLIIGRNLNRLSDKITHEGKEYILHELLTEHGNHSDNLEFFALCFGQQTDVTYEDITALTSKLKSLDSQLKKKLLDSYANIKLPFDNGEIVTYNDFPTISLKTLDDINQIEEAIIKLENHSISEEKLSYKTQFNNPGSDAIKNTKIDLSNLESKYGIKLPENLTNKSFKELRKEIFKDKEFVENQILQQKPTDKKLIQDIGFDLVKLMFEAIEGNRDSDLEIRMEKIMTLLFDSEKSLNEQILDIEFNKKNLDKILKNCADDSQKEELLDDLSRDPYLKGDVLLESLIFLKNIDLNILQEKELTLPKLLANAKQEFISEHFDLFKLTTKFYLESDVEISLSELHSLVYDISEIDNTNSSAKKALSYCAKNKDYSMLKILSHLDAKLDNLTKLIDWLTSLEVSDIKKLNEDTNLDFGKLFKINSVEKIQILADIALKFEKEISKEQYQKIVKQVLFNDIYYAKLLHSYLVAPTSKELPTKAKLDLVMDNLESLEDAQEIFSEYGLWRFNFDKNKLAERIEQVERKNIEDGENPSLVRSEKEALYTSIVAVYEKLQDYKNLTSNEIYDRAAELKHKRSLAKDNNSGEIRELDLEWLTLSCEMMYRTTGLFPRDTQILSAINVIVHADLNLIEEIATGEGKGIVTALVASYLWFTGQTVDVATSAEDLIERDLHGFSPYYHSLDIPHSEHTIKANSDPSDYKKGGINFGTPSDLALFKESINFDSENQSSSEVVDVSLVCDEFDANGTTTVNYKIAVPIISMTQGEVRNLFSTILAFRQSPIFGTDEDKISREADIKNLKMYLQYQFQKYGKYPLSEYQVNNLKQSDMNLHYLYRAYQKCEKNNIKDLFDQWLDAIVTAEGLIKGVDYVLPSPDDFKEDQCLQYAIPLIESQKAEGVVFSVQTFLHLLIEQKYPEYKNKFDMSPPTDTIFNISPKNFFDYYSMSGGRVIGLTGTAGDKDDLEEFRAVNKVLGFSFPRHKDFKGIIKESEVSDRGTQQKTMLNMIDEDPKQPIIIFCDDVNEAEEILGYINYFYKGLRDIQLFAASPHDTTGKVTVALENAGKEGYITITTPMLGRGTDFKTGYEKGFTGISLCEHLTMRGLWQTYGRIGRNGQKGKMFSIFNQEEYLGQSIEEHMSGIANKEREDRKVSQPLTDILVYFNQYSGGKSSTAIAYNKFISQKWYDLLQGNNELSADLRKTYSDLRSDLVVAVKEEYPNITQKLDDYLEKVDGEVPEKIKRYYPEDTCPNFSNMKNPYFRGDDFKPLHYSEIDPESSIQPASTILDDFISLYFECSTTQPIIPLFTRTMHKEYIASYVVQDLKYNGVQITAENFSWSANSYRSMPIDSLTIPTINGEYRAYYNAFYNYQTAVMDTHRFSIEENNFTFPEEYYIHLSANNEDGIFARWIYGTGTSIDKHEMVVFLDKDQKLYCQIKDKAPLEIKVFSNLSTELVNLPKKIYSELLTILKQDEDLAIYTLQPEVKKAILNFALKSGYIDTITVEGEGSGNGLMIPEFKKSFDAYKKHVKSKEVNEIGKLIDNFLNVKNIDTAKLQLGKYQAISITTLVDSTASHAETILTDGKFLFWINRGGGSEDKPGIKIFKIIKNIENVRNILNSLKIPQSQTDTRKAIYSLLREDSDSKVPEYVVVDMESQEIGNCGWVQVKSMLKALALIGRIDSLKELPDITSQEWQKALKDSDDIYLDFEKYDMIKRYEAIIFSLEKEFKPKFLSDEEQKEINARRDIIDTPSSHELLTKLIKTLSKDIAMFDGRYEKQAHKILDIIKLESAVDSNTGMFLQYNDNRESAKNLLKDYQTINSFEHLEQLYKVVTTKSHTDNKMAQASMLQEFIQHMVNNSYHIYNAQEFIEQTTIITKTCSSITADTLKDCVEQQWQLNIPHNDDIILFNNI